MTSSSSIKSTPKLLLVNVYSKAEELANSGSHGIGVILGIVGLVLMLIVSEGEALRITSSIVYGVSIILLFSASTIYHSVTKPAHRRLMKMLDHCAIYLLIAGTYTPYMMITLGNDDGWFYLFTIWAVATAGILFKVLLGHKYPKISLASYLAMGWFIVIAGNEMLHKIDADGIILLAAGGLCYTVGSVFYVWKKLVFNHAIWHLFVLGGAICHFLSIYWFVLPMPA